MNEFDLKIKNRLREEAPPVPVTLRAATEEVLNSLPEHKASRHTMRRAAVLAAALVALVAVFIFTASAFGEPPTSVTVLFGDTIVFDVPELGGTGTVRSLTLTATDFEWRVHVPAFGSSMSR